MFIVQCSIVIEVHGELLAILDSYARLPGPPPAADVTYPLDRGKSCVRVDQHGARRSGGADGGSRRIAGGGLRVAPRPAIRTAGPGAIPGLLIRTAARGALCS